VIFTVIAAASLGAALRESHLLEPTEITFESNRAPLGIITSDGLTDLRQGFMTHGPLPSA
jgi:hypothetical protein